MWDSPRDLNALANLIFFLAAACLLYAAVSLFIRLPLFELRELKVEGMTNHISKDQVEFIVKRMRGNFFTLDIGGVRSDFEKLPWVRRVSVRRSWPHRLDVKIEEHVALARWGTDQLVNTYGEVFDASTDAVLPHLSGPQGSSMDVVREYSAFSRTLLPIGRHVLNVTLSERRSWELGLDDGMVIELGRDRMEQRLSDFAALYERTVGHLDKRTNYVDLRYENGFAVRVPGLKAAA